ncbi:uncharacterized protein LOC118433300 [Folsomia candida]|uniref:uncharacterized protein LOC118433300 n=1 Tax=Folsomia candida TaxID=158441 RepID=UPI001605437E|nr:uncharacterized protein LOC118433300 [Folsomia candida]
MESHPEERTVQEIALNNPIILTEILKQAATPLRTARLVCHFWNEIALTLPNTRLSLILNDKYFRDQDPFSFSALLFSLEDRLAKRISFKCYTEVTYEDGEVEPTVFIYYFASRLSHFCDKFSDTVQILEFSIDNEVCLKYIHQALTNWCHNLRRLRVFCEFTTLKEISLDPLPPKRKLQAFIIYSPIQASVLGLTSFIQVVVNASPNLRNIKIPWGCFPNFANSKFLESLTISLEALCTHDIAAFEPSGLLRMLNQIGDQLVSLYFGESDQIQCIDDYGLSNWTRKEFRLPKRMPKLEKYKNLLVDVFRCDDVLADFERMPVLKTLVIGKTDSTSSACLHEFLQTIFKAGKILGSVKNLKIFELHDPKLLEGLKTAFPNLVRLEVGTHSRTDERGEESGMKLGVVLKACGGWGGLKRIDLSLPRYPKEARDVIPALLEGRELFKGLKTFEIIYNLYTRIMKQHLTLDELDLFKELLLAMNGMDEIIISYLLQFSEKSERKIFEFMLSKNLTVSKFRIFQAKSTLFRSN